MTMNSRIPRPDSQPLDPNGYFMRQWYLYLANLGGGVAGAALAIAAGTASASSGTVEFANGNGVTFGMAGNTITASVGSGASPLSVSAGTLSGTRDSLVFSNSNGLAFGMAGSTITGSYTVPNTSAALTNASQFVQANATFAGTSASGTIASNGISVSIGPYITTAMASNRGSDFVQATAAFAGTNASGTIASNGVSVSVGNYITTAMASNRGSDFVQASATIAGTSISGTIASNVISLSVGPYITTAMASNRGSDFVQANATFAGTNASGTIASNGVSVSVAAQSNAGASASNGSFTFQTLKFADSNGVSFSTGTQGIYATVKTDYQSSGAYLTTAMQSGASTQFVQANATFNGTNASGTIASNAISISVAAPSGVTVSMWPSPLPVTGQQTYPGGSTDTGGGGTLSSTSLTIYLNKIVLPAAVAYSEVRLVGSFNSQQATGSATHEHRMGLYTRTGSTLSLVKSYIGGFHMSMNSSTAVTASWWTATTNTISSVYSTQGNDNNWAGLKWLNLNDGVATTLPAGDYYVAYALFSRTSSTRCIVFNALGQLSNQTDGIPALGFAPSLSGQRQYVYYGAVSTLQTSASNAATFWGLPTSIPDSGITIATGVVTNMSSVIRNHFPLFVGQSL